MGKILFFIFIFVSCLKPEQELQCRSNELFDQNQRKCVKAFGPTSFTLSITNPQPPESYVASINDSDITHSVNIKDEFQNGFNLKWVLISTDGSEISLGEDLSIIFSQKNYSPGDYKIEARLYDANETKLIEKKVWNVLIIDKNTPSITQDTSSPISTTETSGPSIINATINNSGNLSAIQYQWSINGTDVLGQSGVVFGTSYPLSFTFIPSIALDYYTGLGKYDLTLTLRDAFSQSLHTTSTWNITSELAPFATVGLGQSIAFSTTTPSTSETLTLISGIDIASGGLKFDTNSDGSLDNIDICVQADDVTGVDTQGVHVDFFAEGNLLGSTNLTLANTSVCLGDVDPTFSQTLPSTISSEFKTIKAIVYDKYIGFSSKPSYRTYSQLASYTWNVKLRQKNTAPKLTIVDTNAANSANDAINNIINCDTNKKTDTSYLDCEVTQGALSPFSIQVNTEDDDLDPTIDFANFKIEFFLNGNLLDGTHPLSSSDCFFDFGEITSTADYTCAINLNPYNQNGPVNPKNKVYSLSAKVTDKLSPYTGGASPSTSNTVSWFLKKINDSNNAIAINTLTNSGGTTEGSTISFDFNVVDSDSDSFLVELYRAAEVFPIESKIITSQNNLTTKAVSLTHSIPQDTVIGNQSASVLYTVKVTDIPDNNLAATTASTTINVTINNMNEHPTFNTNQFSPALATNLISFTGVPLSIDPGVIEDVTVTDGKNIKYQWLINIDANRNGNFTDDAGFVAIAGATERQLVWTPGQEIDFLNQSGTQAKIKLCIGDDGLIDGTSVSKNPEGNDSCPNNLVALDTSSGNLSNTWDLTIYSNMNGTDGTIHSFNHATYLPYGEVSVWSDDSHSDYIITYMAYIDGTSKNIVIDKMVTHKSGQKSGTTQTLSGVELNRISFPFAPQSGGSYLVKDLSITGDKNRKLLFISYGTDSIPSSGSLITHIRKINLKESKNNYSTPGQFGYISEYARGGSIANNNISVSDSNIISLQHSQLSSLKPTIIEFTSPAAFAANISFISPSHGTTTTFDAGLSYCLTGCTDIDSTSLALVDAINNDSSSAFTNISASYNTSTKKVEILGLDTKDYFTVVSSDPQNPIIVNPSHNQLEFLSTVTGKTVTINTLVINGGVDFCNPGCSDKIQSAKEFAEFINNSTSPFIQGVSAVHLAGTQYVNLIGIENDEFLIKNTNAKKLGHISLNTSLNKWSVPYIDGNNSNKVSILRGSIDNSLYYEDQEIVNLNTIVADSSELANDTDAYNTSLIAIKDLTSSKIYLYEVDAFHLVIDQFADTFNSNNVSNIKIAMNKDIFNTSPEALLLGVTSGALAASHISSTNQNYDLIHATTVTNLGAGFDIITSLDYFDISHGYKDGQFVMAAISDPITPSSYNAYLLNIDSSTNSIEINCSYDNADKLNSEKCMKIKPLATSSLFKLKVDLGDITSSISIGDAGSIENENLANVIPIAYHIDDGGGNIETSAIPIMGLLNVKPLTLNSSSSSNAGSINAIPYVPQTN